MSGQVWSDGEYSSDSSGNYAWRQMSVNAPPEDYDPEQPPFVDVPPEEQGEDWNYGTDNDAFDDTPRRVLWPGATTFHILRNNVDLTTETPYPKPYWSLAGALGACYSVTNTTEQTVNFIFPYNGNTANPWDPDLMVVTLASRFCRSTDWLEWRDTSQNRFYYEETWEAPTPAEPYVTNLRMSLFNYNPDRPADINGRFGGRVNLPVSLEFQQQKGMTNRLFHHFRFRQDQIDEMNAWRDINPDWIWYRIQIEVQSSGSTRYPIGWVVDGYRSPWYGPAKWLRLTPIANGGSGLNQLYVFDDQQPYQGQQDASDGPNTRTRGLPPNGGAFHRNDNDPSGTQLINMQLPQLQNVGETRIKIWYMSGDGAAIDTGDGTSFNVSAGTGANYLHGLFRATNSSIDPDVGIFSSLCQGPKSFLMGPQFVLIDDDGTIQDGVPPGGDVSYFKPWGWLNPDNRPTNFFNDDWAPPDGASQLPSSFAPLKRHGDDAPKNALKRRAKLLK